MSFPWKLCHIVDIMMWVTLVCSVATFPMESGFTHTHFLADSKDRAVFRTWESVLQVVCSGLDPSDEGQKTTRRGGVSKLPTRAGQRPEVL